MISPAMIRPNVMIPKRTTLSRARSAVMTIQPMFSEIAAATSRTHRATKNAIAFWRRVTPRLYAGSERTRPPLSGYGFVGLNNDQAVVFLIRNRLRDLRDLDIPRQAEQPQGTDADPVQIQLVPGEAVTGRNRVRVMVVVPPLAEGEERHPPVVGRVIARREAARAPDVRRRVDEPCRVEADGRAEEDAPEDVGNAAQGEQAEANDDVRDPVPVGKEHVHAILAEVRAVLREDRGVVVET